jgi:plastocyanin
VLVTEERTGWEWRKTQAFGVFGALAMMALLILRVGAFEPFVLIIAVPLIVSLLLRLKLPRVGTVVTGVVAAILLATNLPFLLTDLGHPEGGVDFFLAAMFVLAMVTVIVATIPAYREVRRSGPASSAARGVAAAAVVVLAALGVWALVAGSGYESAIARGDDIKMTQKDFAFVPERLTAEAGEVAVVIENEDAATHTFTIDELGVDLFVPAGKSARVTFQADWPETYRFYCKPHAPDMDGSLTVE